MFKVDGGWKLKNVLSPAGRKQLEKRVMETFADEVKVLSQELQQILADDLVTAFQNRMIALQRIQSKRDLYQG